MLKVDNNVEFVKLPWTPDALVLGSYAVRSGSGKIYGRRWKRRAFEELRATQKEQPVKVVRPGKRILWQFHDRFYWADDDTLTADDVRALVLRRERRRDQELRTAHSLQRATENGRPTRVPIPDDLRRIVFERDGGRCVECGSKFNIQYDHILPVAHGGATTVENLQILCADCNRLKSDSI